MAHPKHEEWMKYLYGELAPPKQQTLADHLQDCGECREQVGAWQTAIKVLDRGKQVDSYSNMNQVLTDLILDRDQAGMQERYMIMEALEQMEQQQAADHEELINAVENLITNMKELGLRR